MPCSNDEAASPNSSAAPDTTVTTASSFLLVCLEATPLPMLEQVRLDSNCDDETFFWNFRRAYKTARGDGKYLFHPNTPRWFRDFVSSARRL